MQWLMVPAWSAVAEDRTQLTPRRHIDESVKRPRQPYERESRPTGDVGRLAAQEHLGAAREQDQHWHLHQVHRIQHMPRNLPAG
jgi:hypothetical protein